MAGEEIGGRAAEEVYEEINDWMRKMFTLAAAAGRRRAAKKRARLARDQADVARSGASYRPRSVASAEQLEAEDYLRPMRDARYWASKPSMREILPRYFEAEQWSGVSREARVVQLRIAREVKDRYQIDLPSVVAQQRQLMAQRQAQVVEQAKRYRADFREVTNPRKDGLTLADMGYSVGAAWVLYKAARECAPLDEHARDAIEALEERAKAEYGADFADIYDNPPPANGKGDAHEHDTDEVEPEREVEHEHQAEDTHSTDEKAAAQARQDTGADAEHTSGQDHEADAGVEEDPIEISDKMSPAMIAGVLKANGTQLSGEELKAEAQRIWDDMHTGVKDEERTDLVYTEEDVAEIASPLTSASEIASELNEADAESWMDAEARLAQEIADVDETLAEERYMAENGYTDALSEDETHLNSVEDVDEAHAVEEMEQDDTALEEATFPPAREAIEEQEREESALPVTSAREVRGDTVDYREELRQSLREQGLAETTIEGMILADYARAYPTRDTAMHVEVMNDHGSEQVVGLDHEAAREATQTQEH